MPSETGEPPVGSFPKQQSSMREGLPLPHIASLTYFRSPQKSQSACPIPRLIPPTPRKMSSIPIVNQTAGDFRCRRRQSSILRPISALARSPEKPRFHTPTNTSDPAPLQTSSPTVQSRTYSRTQRSSVPSAKASPPSSRQFSRDLLPRSDSLLPNNQRPANDDPTGIRQQLHLRNYSTQSLASSDAAFCSNRNRTSTSLPLPAQRGLPKSKTLTSSAKSSPNPTPQRRLMKPIGPPLPRSQTMGSLFYFAGDGAKEVLSPIESDSSPVMTPSGTKLGVLDVLQESRMTDSELDLYKRVGKREKSNIHPVQRICKKDDQHSATDSREFSSSFSKTSNITPPQAVFPTGISRRFGRIDVTKNDEMDRKLLRRDRDHRRDKQTLPADGTTSGGLHFDKLSDDMVCQPPTPMTPDEVVERRFQRPVHHVLRTSAGDLCLQPLDFVLNVESSQGDEWEVNVKLVHFYQGLPYWTGRFSSICDRLKTADAHLLSSTCCRAPESLSVRKQPEMEENYEAAERRRLKDALEELKSYCRTSAAIDSFDDFETQLRVSLDKRAEEKMKVVHGRTVQPAEHALSTLKLIADSRPKLGWHFGQSQMSHITGKTISIGTAPATQQRFAMVKSKTTSSLTSMVDRGNETIATQDANPSGPSDAKSLPGLSWQRPTVQEAQAHAKRIREQRVFAKAATYRKASGQDSAVGKGRTGGIKELAGTRVAQGGQIAEPQSANIRSVAKVDHARKSSGADSLNLKKVLSDSVKGMRKVTRSFTGSGSASGHEKNH